MTTQLVPLLLPGDVGDVKQSTIADTYARLCRAKKIVFAARTVGGARTPGKKVHPAAKRQGAKKAKAFERLQSAGPILDPEEATAFRALAARGNYLA